MRRSLTLWVGLFVLVFLVGAWWDSGRYCSYAEFSRPAWTVSIYSWDATLRCSLNTAPDAFVSGGLHFGHDDLIAMGRMPNLELEQGSLYFDLQGPYREIRLAAWIVILLFFNAWIFLLLWSYLRRKNRQEALQVPEATTAKSYLPFPPE